MSTTPITKAPFQRPGTVMNWLTGRPKPPTNNRTPPLQTFANRYPTGFGGSNGQLQHIGLDPWAKTLESATRDLDAAVTQLKTFSASPAFTTLDGYLYKIGLGKPLTWTQGKIFGEAIVNGAKEGVIPPSEVPTLAKAIESVTVVPASISRKAALGLGGLGLLGAAGTAYGIHRLASRPRRTHTAATIPVRYSRRRVSQSRRLRSRRSRPIRRRSRRASPSRRRRVSRRQRY